jgi:hypothetical protein
VNAFGSGKKIYRRCDKKSGSSNKKNPRIHTRWHVTSLLLRQPREKVDVDLGAMVPVEVFAGWRFKTQFWLRDIRIRTNMTSSAWVDLGATLAAKDGSVYDDGGAEIPEREVLRMLDELPENGPVNAAFRWVVAVGEDNQMKLQLQSLPGSAVLVAGKPTLRQ